MVLIVTTALLLLLVCVENIWCITMCKSSVIINGVSVEFHVDDARQLKRVASEFCSVYGLPSTECEQIIRQHHERCFPDDTNKIQDDINDNNSENEDEINIHFDNKNRNSNYDSNDLRFDKQYEEELRLASLQTSEIDYSRKEGPVLTVDLSQLSSRQSGLPQIHQVQKYAGEGSRRAVLRFCTVHKLTTSQCDIVQDAFNKLENKKTKGDSDSKNSIDVQQALASNAIPVNATELSLFIEWVQETNTNFWNENWFIICVALASSFLLIIYA